MTPFVAVISFSDMRGRHLNDRNHRNFVAHSHRSRPASLFLSALAIQHRMQLWKKTETLEVI